MKINAVQDIVTQAINDEQNSQSLLRQITQIVSQSNALPIEKSCSAEALHNFIVEYVQNIPVFANYIRKYASALNIDSYTQPLTDMAMDYFLKAHTHSESAPKLVMLLNEAYFAHRVFEEFNERIMARCSQAITPADTTTANLIIHQLIGEPFVNELDEGVSFALTQNQTNEAVLNKLDEQATSSLTIDLVWPDFCQQQHIEFDPISLGQLKTG